MIGHRLAIAGNLWEIRSKKWKRILWYSVRISWNSVYLRRKHSRRTQDGPKHLRLRPCLGLCPSLPTHNPIFEEEYMNRPVKKKLIVKKLNGDICDWIFLHFSISRWPACTGKGTYGLLSTSYCTFMFFFQQSTIKEWHPCLIVVSFTMASRGLTLFAAVVVQAMTDVAYVDLVLNNLEGLKLKHQIPHC